MHDRCQRQWRIAWGCVYQAVARVGSLSIDNIHRLKGVVANLCYDEDSYSQNNITDAEFNSLPGRVQEAVRRTAQHHAQQAAANQWGGGYYPAAAPPTSTFKRYGELCERHLSMGLCIDGVEF